MASKLPTVAIIGRANAGKSSLFNRMVRSQQAIVAREGGTRRGSDSGTQSVNERDCWGADSPRLRQSEP